MSLADAVSGSGLHGWAELGLIVSFVAFVALLVWLFVIRRGASFDHQSRLPLEKDQFVAPPDSEPSPGTDRPEQETEDR